MIQPTLAGKPYHVIIFAGSKHVLLLTHSSHPHTASLTIIDHHPQPFLSFLFIYIYIYIYQTQEMENKHKRIPAKLSVKQKQKVFEKEQEEAAAYPDLPQRLPTIS